MASRSYLPMPVNGKLRAVDAIVQDGQFDG
jgi:hypothetical protein